MWYGVNSVCNATIKSVVLCTLLVNSNVTIRHQNSWCSDVFFSILLDMYAIYFTMLQLLQYARNMLILPPNIKLTDIEY